MNKYYILSLKKSSECDKLSSILKSQNFKSNNSFNLDSPILIDPQNKIYTNLDYSVIKQIEAVKYNGKAKFCSCNLTEFENDYFNTLTK